MPSGCSTFEGACRSRFARVNTSGLIKSFASARIQGVIAPSGAQAPSGRQWLTMRIEGDANSCCRYFRSCFCHSASYAWGPLWARGLHGADPDSSIPTTTSRSHHYQRFQGLTVVRSVDDHRRVPVPVAPPAWLAVMGNNDWRFRIDRGPSTYAASRCCHRFPSRVGGGSGERRRPRTIG